MSADWHAGVYGASSDVFGTKRRKPRKPVQRVILERQGNVCAYCDAPFGSMYKRRGKVGVLRLQWDHFVPYSYTNRNPGTDGWIAACHVCNQIKGCLMFEDVDKARRYLSIRRNALGVENLGE